MTTPLVYTNLSRLIALLNYQINKQHTVNKIRTVAAGTLGRTNFGWQKLAPTTWPRLRLQRPLIEAISSKKTLENHLTPFIQNGASYATLLGVINTPPRYPRTPSWPNPKLVSAGTPTRFGSAGTTTQIIHGCSPLITIFKKPTCDISPFLRWKSQFSILLINRLLISTTPASQIDAFSMVKTKKKITVLIKLQHKLKPQLPTLSPRYLRIIPGYPQLQKKTV